MNDTQFHKKDSPLKSTNYLLTWYRAACMCVLAVLCLQASLHAQQPLGQSSSIIADSPNQDAYPLVSNNKASVLWFDAREHHGVIRAIGDLQMDIERVTSQKPEIMSDQPDSKQAVIIGTVGKSEPIDALIASGKLDANKLEGKWESFVITTVENPAEGVNRALVVAGSDKRGTIYGIYEISKQIGVSPWYYWADVPVQPKKELLVKSGFFFSGEPKVKYRGIFINDEAPALTNWAKEKFGGFNHEFYEHVFELILRNRGNYLWPAMWLPNAFNDDDPENPRVADEYGVVMSTSHHEPMMRAHHEWYRFGEGAWNYETNKENLQEFWRGGIERMGDYESVVTVGMRGDGDEALTEDTAIELLQTIIEDQRGIIEDVTGKPAEETPQVWALYKEVQDYYDKGMRVPEDILILFSDDNWGNVRYLPKKEDRDYPGGYGMYYHFDYVGGPTSYRWQNVTQIEKVWEQMNLTYQWGVDDLWIVNVGDIKPMEFPISFFLDFAWNPEAIEAGDLPDYYLNWAENQFGETYAEEVAEVIKLYSKYSARRTHEMISPETFSLENYREADRVLAEWKKLYEKAKSIYNKLPESHKSAFYQLGLFPVESSYNLNKMYVAAGKNKYYAERGAAAANYYADQVKKLFEKDAELARYYHEELEDGKWNHMMSQTHIGYTYWNHPPVNKMPAVSYVHTQQEAELGYLIEYGASPPWGWIDVEGDWWFQTEMPAFNQVNNQEYYINILNRGKEPLTYTISAKEDWIQLSSKGGELQHHEKIYVSIDWDKAPKENTRGEIVISGPKKEHTVQVPIQYVEIEPQGFVENNGVVSINAANYQSAENTETARWVTVPNLGRTHSSVTVEPADTERTTPGENTPYLEYTFTVFDSTEVKVDTYLSPTLNFKKDEGLKYAIAVNEEEPQVINIHEGDTGADWEYPEWWNESVTNRIKIKRSTHNTVAPGTHTLKVWMVDPGVVFQKFVIDAGGLEPSYFGPPESDFVAE